MPALLRFATRTASYVAAASMAKRHVAETHASENPWPPAVSAPGCARRPRRPLASVMVTWRLVNAAMPDVVLGFTETLATVCVKLTWFQRARLAL
jgi:hypothetical protein